MTVGVKGNLLIFIVLSFFHPQRAAAHDGWVEIAPSIVEKGQVATISLIQGNHSNEHRSYRIAGKWDKKYTTLMIVDPNGKQNTLTDQLIDLGEDEQEVGPKRTKGSYLVPFTAKEDGLYLTLARQVRTIQQGDGPKLLTSRTAKTMFAAFTAPSVSAAKNLKGFERVLGDEDSLEIIPLNNPLGLFPGDSIALEVRHNGKPCAETEGLLRFAVGAGGK